MKKRRRGREGMTLVELIVSLALLGIMMVMVIGVMSPAAKTFARMQRLQFAQIMLDNVEDEIRAQLQNAVGNVKIYGDSGNVADTPGAGSGAVLEFVNTDSYVTLLSADGCGKTTLMRSGQAMGSEEAPAGRLLLRYYWQQKAASGGNPYGYHYMENGKPVARAVQQVFSNKYYMGNYLKLQFSFPDGVNEGDSVGFVNVRAELYRDPARTDLLVSEEFVAELRYQATRQDQKTAGAGS